MSEDPREQARNRHPSAGLSNIDRILSPEDRARLLAAYIERETERGITELDRWRADR